MQRFRASDRAMRFDAESQQRSPKTPWSGDHSRYDEPLALREGGAVRRRVAMVLAGLMVCGMTACGGGGNMFGDEPNTPVAVSGLPSDPKDALQELRRRLVGEGVAIARGLAFPVQRAVFAFEAGRNRKLRKANLFISLGVFPQEQWPAVQAQFAEAVRAQGWQMGRQGLGQVFFKDGYTIWGSCLVERCAWDLYTGDVERAIDQGDYSIEVPELFAPQLQPTGVMPSLPRQTGAAGAGSTP